MEVEVTETVQALTPARSDHGSGKVGQGQEALRRRMLPNLRPFEIHVNLTAGPRCAEKHAGGNPNHNLSTLFAHMQNLVPALLELEYLCTTLHRV